MQTHIQTTQQKNEDIVKLTKFFPPSASQKTASLLKSIPENIIHLMQPPTLRWVINKALNVLKVYEALNLSYSSLQICIIVQINKSLPEVNF